MLAGLLTGGATEALYNDTYEIKNEETGEFRRVAASNSDELGAKIEAGEFIVQLPAL
jgi:hypothetical protein